MTIALNNFIEGPPRIFQFSTEDSLATVIGINYMADFNADFPLYTMDFLFISYAEGSGIFQPTFALGNITLVKKL